MNEAAKDHLLKSLKQNVRFDGRKCEEFREISVETGMIATAEGSARVKIGDTEVIAGVKMSVGAPYSDRPDEGVMMVGAELLPLSNPDFESGPPSIQSIELARVIDRGIRESKAIDAKKLCITAGEKVWMVQVDICSINDAGNLLDAGGIAAMLAILDARFPKYDAKTNSVDYKKRTDETLPLTVRPISVTVSKIGEYLLVDPLTEEEEFVDCRLTVASTPDGKLCAMQKGGATPLSQEEIVKMVDIALEKSAILREKIGG